MGGTTRAAGVERVVAVDVARALGLFLVYHGHVVERMMYLGHEAAAHQYKFIYAFHMPLFFLLAGCIAKDLSSLKPLAFLWSRVTSRLVPLLAFNGLLVLTSLVFPRDFPPIPLESAADYGNAALMSLTWLTVFNVPTWFLMALTTVEVVHYILFRFLRGSNLALLLVIVAGFVLGAWLNRQFAFFPGRNWWLWNEAPMAYAFYLAGILVNRAGFMASPPRTAAAVLAAVAAFAALFLVYDLNQGPFRLDIKAVVILASAYGDPLWFALGAMAGIIGTLALGRALAGSSWLAHIGSNALVVFALNGVFYHHINGPLAAWYLEAMPQDGWTLGVFAAGVSVVSIVLTLPLVRFCNAWLPQLVGRPRASGPLLPALLR
jgi:acyltransferase